MYKLKRQKDFDIVFKKGKKAFTKNLSMFFYENVKDIKIGISVSKKHGHAVLRNRIKRLLRACYIPLINNIKKPVYIVFVPKISLSYDFNEFNKSVSFLLEKENFI